VAFRVLVVEDAPEYAQLVTAVLRAEQYEVMTATTLSDARDRMRSTPPDLVILDLTLPDGDGLDLCQEIRRNSDAFVILLTGRHDEVDKLVGFRLGADDYVTKPFSPRELAARVGALLARTRGSTSAARSATQHIGNLTIDTETRHVTVDGNVAELTKIEFDLLDALTERPGSVLTRSQLLMAVWGDNYIGDDHVVDVHIANLRRKIDTGKPSHVRTVRGVGYAINN
jgi:DNA-binding response OmpR family regulator